VTLDARHSAPPAVLVLAFVTAGRQGCTPTWGGSVPLEDPGVRQQIRRWRSAGRELRVSFGGQSGTDLAVGCRDVDQLTAAYRRVVDAVSPAVVDLDVEGPALLDAASVQRRNRALRALQADAERRGAPVRVSFTLPADSSGLPAAALALLRDARGAGVQVDAVNAMTMNYGQAPSDPAGQAMVVATSVHDALRRLYPDADPGALSRKVWVTPMIGRNDVAPQVFTTADATRLAARARAQGLGGLAFWSLARDRPCPAGTTEVSPTCSGVDAPAAAFAEAFSAFAAR
jgi:hypothetical protein